MGLTVAAQKIPAVFHHRDAPPDVCASTVNIAQHHMEKIWGSDHHFNQNPRLWILRISEMERKGERRKESTKAKDFS